MDYAELSATQYRRTREFSKAHTDVMAMYCDAERDLKELQAENAKLRELVRYAYECAIHSDHATCDDCRRMNSSCILADRMRELGIEVDG